MSNICVIALDPITLNDATAEGKEIYIYIHEIIRSNGHAGVIVGGGNNNRIFSSIIFHIIFE